MMEVSLLFLIVPLKLKAYANKMTQGEGCPEQKDQPCAIRGLEFEPHEISPTLGWRGGGCWRLSSIVWAITQSIIVM